jgi:hypothetical protein
MAFSRRKKGAIEVQFNWIFVLIVGALILVFFINISNAQKKSADQKLAMDLLSKVDLIMSGALTIPKTGQVFDMPSIPFNLECSRISMSGVSRQFPDRIIFGPDTLKGKKLLIISQDWTAPYKVTNFLYMTTSGVRYIIVADPSNQAAKKFYDALPDNITKEISELDDISDKNNYKIKLIFLQENHQTLNNLDFSNTPAYILPQFMQRLPDSAVSAVYIRGYSGVIVPPDVRFAVKKGTRLEFFGDNVSIYKEPMIIGAVFAENRDEFNCSIEKAFTKLHFVSQVYKLREDNLASNYAPSTMEECKSPSTRAATEIEDVSVAAANRDISAIIANEQQIVTNNNNALRSSCASIY